MDWKQQHKYRDAKLKRHMQLLLKWDKKLPQIDKDIIRLEMMECDINPYSRYWRWGMVGTLRRARKALEKLKEETTHGN